ncbi:MAG: SurA N-terminal domain-containing protein [Chloroflexota bacterium]
MRGRIRQWLLVLCTGLLGLGLLVGWGCTAPDEDVPAAVAVVNGEEITTEEFQRHLDEYKAMYEQQGVPLEGEQLAVLKQQIVDHLVQQMLLAQEAELRGIVAIEDEIQSEYQEIVSGFPNEEAFEQALEAQGLSQEDLKRLIADGIKVERLLDSVVEEAEVVAPTEDELREAYDQYSQQYGEEPPPYEELKGQLEADLLEQRRNEVIQGFIEELRAKSDIEVLLQ